MYCLLHVNLMEILLLIVIKLATIIERSIKEITNQNENINIRTMYIKKFILRQ